MAPEANPDALDDGGAQAAAVPHLADDVVIGDWTVLVAACARVRAEARRSLAARHALDLSVFEVLFQLSRCPAGRQTSSELAAEVSYSSGGFTKLADRLERDGLVVRRSDARDRRLVWIELTEAGFDVVGAASVDHAAFLRDALVERLGAERFSLVAQAMRTLLEADAPA